MVFFHYATEISRIWNKTSIQIFFCCTFQRRHSHIFNNIHSIGGRCGDFPQRFGVASRRLYAIKVSITNEFRTHTI